MFIQIEELKIRKFESLIDDISEDNNYILEELELMAVDEITGYLKGRYDTDYIFSRTGSDRSPKIRRLTMDFILCFLYDRGNSNEKPDSLIETCDKNVDWLSDVQTGKLSANLPVLDPALEATTMFQGGSEVKFSNTDNID